MKYYLLTQFTMALVYHGTMRLSPFQAVTLPFTVFDNLIPYNDVFAAIYLSFFVLLFHSVRYTTIEISFACARAVIYTSIAAGILFICFPTVYKVSSSHGEKRSLLFQLIKNYDRNYNCFPSLHVAVSLICCYYAGIQKLRLKKFLYGVWFLLLFASVLVTQQHYFFDALGGLFLGALTLFVNNIPTQAAFKIK